MLYGLLIVVEDCSVLVSILCCCCSVNVLVVGWVIDLWWPSILLVKFKESRLISKMETVTTLFPFSSLPCQLFSHSSPYSLPCSEICLVLYKMNNSNRGFLCLLSEIKYFCCLVSSLWLIWSHTVFNWGEIVGGRSTDFTAKIVGKLRLQNWT